MSELNEADLLDGESISHSEIPDENELLGDIKKEDDLYDAVIEPLHGNDHRNESFTNVSATTTNGSQANRDTGGKKYCCYVGNMTWWTTDLDLLNAFEDLGISDFVDMKFYENRTNGQSKGYCLLVFGSEVSVSTLMSELPKRTIHNQTLVVLPYTKASLQKFEEAAAKAAAANDPTKKKDGSVINMGTIRIGAGPPPMSAGRGMQASNILPQVKISLPSVITGGMMGRGAPVGPSPTPLMSLITGAAVGSRPMMNPHMTNSMSMGAPPGIGVPPQMTTAPPGVPPGMGAPPPMMNRGTAGMPMNPGMMSMGGPPGMGGVRLPPQPGPPGIPPGAHINPQVYPGYTQMGGPPGQAMSMGGMRPGGDASMSSIEFEEVMNRNRTVSSSAISRAVSDAATGDVDSAIETLLTAISLIKQSKVAHDDRCKLLISSLQDTLAGIETKASSGGSRKHRRDRSRSRSRERDRKRYRRSRSRSREHDRRRY